MAHFGEKGESRGKSKRPEEEKQPFEEADDLSDITLLAEGRTIHAHKFVLSLYSPVFKRMFHSEFREKTDRQIKLPGKSYKDILSFVKQMYPVHCLQPITDNALVSLLALADEYQAEHIRRKCEGYIEFQTTSHVDRLSADQELLYLRMCEVHNFAELRGRLIEIAAQRSAKELTTSRYYKSVPLTAINDVIIKRCCQLELETGKLSNENTEVQSRYDKINAEYCALNKKMNSFVRGGDREVSGA